MPLSRRLVMNLESRCDGEVTSLGVWDLTVPALFSIEDGTIALWLEGRIPASAQLSLSVPHLVRRAAWDNSLFYREPPQHVHRFIDYTKSFASIDDLIQRTETLISAQRIRVYAENLLEQVRGSRPVAPDRSNVFHPLTGEIIPSSDYLDAVPFKFATMKRHWKGVDAKELYDFTLAFGKPDANAFLAAMFSGSKDRFNDVGKLDDAILTLARTRDVELFKDIVLKWNHDQRLILNFGDHSRLVTEDGIDGYRAALEWCDDFVRLALQLEDSVKDFLFSRKEAH